MIKKTVTLLLLVVLLLPNALFAAVEPQDTGAPVGGIPAFEGSLTGATEGNTGGLGSVGAAEEGERVTAAGIAGKVNCGTRRGGAFQRALSEYGGRLGDAALNGIADGISGRGPIGDAVGDILRGDGIG
ncbi:hypothetical protein K2X83_01015, partial [Patescibacteria group bacterium]|nr:hypothetical protein [Patescibacteria group bacterium]